MNNEQLKKLECIQSLVGRTPLLKINFKFRGKLCTIYAKAEYYNLTGSIKDRMAYHILRKAYQTGAIKEGDCICEATSGNTGIAISAIGRMLGHSVTIYMPNWMSIERQSVIRGYGAEVRLVTPEEGGFLGSIAMAESRKKECDKVFLPRQFDNHANCEAHYTTTGPEIWAQMEQIGEQPDIFVAGVGTGGTAMGVGKYFKERDPSIKIHPMEPENSPTLRTGYKVGKHRIQGISDEFIPSIVDLTKLDDIVSVDDGDGIIMAQKLARSLGLGVGISSGANFIAAVKLLIDNPGARVVTVFSDDNKKYLSTDYIKEEPVKEGMLSPEIELLGMEAIRS
ncbi:Cysteine synthase [Mucinivorans hirudinis]|uniref:cysteine synthase n=1 Tax=Mucinivorans hirudinis TaxID=1433126 RepID=A0A060RB69_9BACT|nr:Cysteine synthase [Mucinivorans hirudinis]